MQFERPDAEKGYVSGKTEVFQTRGKQTNALRNGVEIKKARKYNPEVIVPHVEHKSAKRTRRMKKALCAIKNA
jgi:hypothetical protein